MSDAPDKLVVRPRAIFVERKELPALLSGFFHVAYLAGGIVGCIAGLAHNSGIAELAYCGPIFAWPVLIVSYTMSTARRAVRKATLEVRADGDLVFIEPGGRRRVAKKDLRGALVVLRNGETTVEVESAGGDRLIAVVDGPSEARAFVERLGFGPRGARIETSLATPNRRFLHLVFAFIAWIVGVYVALSETLRDDAALYSAGIGPLVTLAIYHALKWLGRPPVVVIGDEGIVMKSALRPKVISRGAAMGVALEPLLAIGIDYARIGGILRAVAERHAESATTDDAVAAFARGERSLPEWRAQLRVKMEQSGYRAAAAPTETAESVLRDARATAEARVGAAVALRIAGEPAEKIRVAADATVDDALREALEAVAEEGDDVHLERRLARLSAQ